MTKENSTDTHVYVYQPHLHPSYGKWNLSTIVLLLLFFYRCSFRFDLSRRPGSWTSLMDNRPLYWYRIN